MANSDTGAGTEIAEKVIVGGNLLGDALKKHVGDPLERHLAPRLNQAGDNVTKKVHRYTGPKKPGKDPAKEETRRPDF